MSRTVRVEGLREVKKALRTLLPDNTAKSVMRKILKGRAQPIAAAARARVPKDTHELADAIGVGTRLTRRQKRLHRKVDRHDVEVFVGVGRPKDGSSDQAVPYGHIVEFGGNNQPARPFMRPAWDAAKGSILNNIGRDMMDEIKKRAAKLRNKLK